MSDTCACGDVLDEHEDNGGACTIDGCPCIAFDPLDGDDLDDP